MGVRRWWECELINPVLIFRGRTTVPASQVSTAPIEAW